MNNIPMYRLNNNQKNVNREPMIGDTIDVIVEIDTDGNMFPAGHGGDDTIIVNSFVCKAVYDGQVWVVQTPTSTIQVPIVAKTNKE